MIFNKELRVFAVAALGLGLFSANAFAESVESDINFGIEAIVEDSISVEGLNDVSLDLDNRDQDGAVVDYQDFSIMRRGATVEAPGKFSITATSTYGASSVPGYHLIQNEKEETLPMAIYFQNDLGEGYLSQATKLSDMYTTNQENEHRLMVGFHQDDLVNPKPGTYSSAVTITVAAE